VVRQARQGLSREPEPAHPQGVHFGPSPWCRGGGPPPPTGRNGPRWGSRRICRT